jgi:hypothetical protein
MRGLSPAALRRQGNQDVECRSQGKSMPAVLDLMQLPPSATVLIKADGTFTPVWGTQSIDDRVAQLQSIASPP